MTLWPEVLRGHTSLPTHKLAGPRARTESSGGGACLEPSVKDLRPLCKAVCSDPLGEMEVGSRSLWLGPMLLVAGCMGAGGSQVASASS